jgi:hypothetical protein
MEEKKKHTESKASYSFMGQRHCCCSHGERGQRDVYMSPIMGDAWVHTASIIQEMDGWMLYTLIN